jgi:hypothetical protein
LAGVIDCWTAAPPGALRAETDLKAHLPQPASILCRGPPRSGQRRPIPLHGSAASATLDGGSGAAGQLGFKVANDRYITRNVLASCDDVAVTRAKAFGKASAMIDTFLAVPGSATYEQMKSGAWEYRIMRADRA